MNKTDVKNINAIIKYRKVIEKGPIFIDGGDYQKDYINSLDNEKLQELIDGFKNKLKNDTIKILKELVDKMFAKYGVEGDNMIAISAANYWDRDLCDQHPLDSIDWKGFNNDYNKLYFPICTSWNNLKNIQWDEYEKDIEQLNNILDELNIKNACDYWKDDNDALNELWYGVIGIMKDYRVVAFVIRDDGMLCDENGYETFNNHVIEQF